MSLKNICKNDLNFISGGVILKRYECSMDSRNRKSEDPITVSSNVSYYVYKDDVDINFYLEDSIGKFDNYEDAIKFATENSVLTCLIDCTF